MHLYSSTIYCNILLIIGIFSSNVLNGEGQNTRQEVTAYPGYGVNTTFYVVNDKVPWFTANEGCPKEITSSWLLKCGKSCIIKIIAELRKLVLTDTFLWIGLLKQPDDVVYDGSCQRSEKLLPLIVGGESNRRECVGINTTSGNLNYDICEKIHPYICREIHEDLGLMHFPNVHVSFDETVKWDSKTFYGEDVCYIKCETYITCLAFLYNYNEDSCQRIFDAANDILSSRILVISTDHTLDNYLKVKSSPRTYLTQFTPRISRRYDAYTELNCIDGTTTTTTTRSCCCLNGSKFIKYTNETLSQWVKNITNTLIVDKKQLSSYTRTLISAEDSRLSSKAIGLLGASLVGIVIFVLTFQDVVHFIFYCKNVIQNR